MLRAYEFKSRPPHQRKRASVKGCSFLLLNGKRTKDGQGAAVHHHRREEDEAAVPADAVVELVEQQEMLPALGTRSLCNPAPLLLNNL